MNIGLKNMSTTGNLHRLYKMAIFLNYALLILIIHWKQANDQQ